MSVIRGITRKKPIEMPSGILSSFDFIIGAFTPRPKLSELYSVCVTVFLLFAASS